MAGKIFISYRRSDAEAYAGRIYDRLEGELGRDRLFMDVDSISLGVDFTEALRGEVAKCDALLAIIGEHWLDADDGKGGRRLDDPNDFVRIEIAAALKRSIPVIPVLVGNSRLPNIADLPSDLAQLCHRNGLHVHHASFGRDISKLINELKGLLDESGGQLLASDRSVTNLLNLSVGEDGQFVAIPKHSLYGLTRQLAVCVENQSASQAVTDCKVQITEIEPFSGVKLPRILKSGFSLAAGDHTFIPLVQYGEARDPAKYNCADTLIELLGGDRPISIAHDVPSFIKLRATGIGAPYSQTLCKVWIDPHGRLRTSARGLAD
jgi:hypothetical protein